MKKIVIIFAAMAAVLSSCSKSGLESVSVNDGKDIVLNISVSSPGADTKALIKEGWVNGDEISIWYDENVQETPDLVITYNGTKWIQKEGATVSGNTPSTGTGKYAKSLYNGTVKVTSKDDYTYENNTLTFSIANWKFLTEVQVVVTGLTSTSDGSYTLACDKFTPLAAGAGYTVGSEAITASAGTKGVAVTGISNTDGVAFVFASAEYSSTAADYKFTLTNTLPPAVTKVYTATTDKINGTSGEMTAIKALTIANDKFKVPVNPLYVEIEADYDNDLSTPNTSLKWYRQNLAITTSGDKKWKGDNTSAVKVPGTSEDVKVGDYFQWAASYAGYNITDEDKKKPENLLLYTSFDNKEGVGDANDKFYTDGGSFSKSFNISNAPYGGTPYSKYNTTSSPNTLERTETVNDDVASIILGGTWRMPKSAEFFAMKAATYWAWDATDKGYYVFSQDATHTAGTRVNSVPADLNKSDALLFFPAAGYGSTTFLYGAGSYGYYWSSSLYTDYTAYYLYFLSSNVDPQSSSHRYCGFSVRPVSD